MSDASFDTGRLARTLTLIVFVTAVFLFLVAQRLEGELLAIGTIAVGTVALVTALIGFLVAAASVYDEQTRL